MANYLADFSLTFNFNSDNLEVRNTTTTLSANGVEIDDTIRVYIEKIVTPNGTTTLNPIADNTPDLTYLFNPLSNGIVKIEIAKYDDSTIQTGNYYIEYAFTVNGDTYTASKTFTFLGYNKVEPKIEVISDCVIPRLSTEDVTDYEQSLQSDITNTAITRLHTIESSKNGIADITGTSLKLETDTFYSGENLISFNATVLYEIGNNSDFYIKDVLSIEDQKKQVVCIGDLCTVYSIVEQLNNKYNNDSEFTGNPTESKNNWLRAIGLMTMIQRALICGISEGLQAYVDEIVLLANDCGCGCGEASGEPILIQGYSEFENNSLTVAYADDEFGTGYSDVVQTSTKYVGFVEHNKNNPPTKSDYNGLWIKIISEGGGTNPPSTDGLRQIADDTEYTEGETIYNTANSETNFYYVEITFTTDTPFDINQEITEGNLIPSKTTDTFTKILDYEAYSVGSNDDVILYPKNTVLKDPNSSLIVRAKIQSNNTIPLNNQTYWENIGGSTGLDRDIRNTTGAAVGGIGANEVILATSTATERWAKLLEVTQTPDLIAPTFSLSKSASTLQKIGSRITFNLTFNFNRGQIRGALVNGIWQPNTEQNKRAGEAIQYGIDGIDQDVDQVQGAETLSVTKTIAQGDNTYIGTVTYGVGAQPLNSINENFGSPLQGAISPIQTTTIEGVYPLFATTANISTATEQAIVSMLTANNIQKTLVAETGGNKQFFDIPNDWLNVRAISSVQFFNTVSGQFDTTNQLATFTQSQVNNTVSFPFNGGTSSASVAYTRFTNNTANRGSILIKIIF